LQVAKSTLCGWHEKVADLVRPVVEAMRADGFTQPYLCVDATGVLVLAKERCRTGHFWVTVAPEKHVLFAYSKRHDSAAVDELLADYSGYLVADAHALDRSSLRTRAIDPQHAGQETARDPSGASSADRRGILRVVRSGSRARPR
jgi:hypothetical protein